MIAGWATAAFFALIFPGNISQYVNPIDVFGLTSDLLRFLRLFFNRFWRSGLFASPIALLVKMTLRTLLCSQAVCICLQSATAVQAEVSTLFATFDQFLISMIFTNPDSLE